MDPRIKVFGFGGGFPLEPLVTCSWRAGCVLDLEQGVAKWYAEDWRVIMPDGHIFACRNEGDARAIYSEWMIKG